MTPRLNIVSIGRAAGELQVPLTAIRKAATELGIVPHKVNGVIHFDADDLERIDRRVRTSNGQREISRSQGNG